MGITLQEDASGALRVGQSRVLLELVIHAFQDGATPETIVHSYPSVSLADFNGVILRGLLRRRDREGSRRRSLCRMGRRLPGRETAASAREGSLGFPWDSTRGAPQFGRLSWRSLD